MVGKAGDAAANRVKLSHRQTRPTLRLALLFIVAAALSAPVSTGSWLPLHLLLAGGAVLAISGVSLMLTVTWSAAPAPPDRAVLVQRSCVAVGAAGVAVGRSTSLPSAVVAASGILYSLGLALLAVLLVTTFLRGSERRFAAAVAAYLCAMVAGITAVTLGVTMAVHAPTSDLRAVHATLNLLGLVGLTISGTLPYFAATVGRARMASRATKRSLVAVLAWQVAALAVAVAGLVAGAGPVVSGGFAAYALGVVVVVTLLPRPTRRQLKWAGPRLVGLWAGSVWWAAAVAAFAVAAAGGNYLAGSWLLVLVVAGYAQIIWGSLAYLLPVLRGGGHVRLGEGFATTRSWVGLAAANVAGVALAVQARYVAFAAVAVWVLDSLWRAVAVGTRRSPRPSEETGAGED